MNRELPNYLVLLSVFALLSAPAFCQKKQPNGALLFAERCAKCHQGGGNSIKPKKTVTGSKHLSTLAVFKAYLASPPGHMPHYQDLVNNKDLLKALYDYCKQLKEKPVKDA